MFTVYHTQFYQNTKIEHEDQLATITDVIDFVSDNDIGHVLRSLDPFIFFQ